LLSLTLLFSTLTAGLGMATNAPVFGLISITIYFGLLFLTQAFSNSAWGIIWVFAFTGFMGYILGQQCAPKLP
jgi:modulator of FtsH protease